VKSLDFTRTKTVIERSRRNYGIKSLPAPVTTNGQKPAAKAVAVDENFPFDENRLF
jgi:hypothetical protein